MPKFPCLLGKFELVRVTSVIFYLYEEMEICYSLVIYEEIVSQDLTLQPQFSKSLPPNPFFLLVIKENVNFGIG